jgi:hypothetical protein
MTQAKSELSKDDIERIRQLPEHHSGEFDYKFDEQSFARAIIKADRELRGEVGGYRARHSQREKWKHSPTPQNLWECQPLYTVPLTTAPQTELEEAVMAALDDLKLVLDGTMGTKGLETTFVALVEALDPNKVNDTDWDNRYKNAVERFRDLSHKAISKVFSND